MVCNEKPDFFTSDQPKRYNLWSCQKVFDTLHNLLDNICTICVLNLFHQIVGITMGINIMLLLLQICFVMRDFMLSLSDNNQAGVIEAFYSTSRYLAV